MDFGRFNKAFTLAEVLITLTIIGVIAALTIPTLMKKFEHKELEVRFKKAYATCDEAVKKAAREADSDNLYNTEDTPYTNAINNIYKQFKINTETAKYVDRSHWYTFYNFDGSNYAQPYGRAYFSGMGEYLVTVRNFGGINIVIDTNGAKKPNRYGYDIFQFEIDKKTGKLLAGAFDVFNYTRGKDSRYCTRSVHAWNGIHCAYYALINKNPDNRSEGYWDSLD